MDNSKFLRIVVYYVNISTVSFHIQRKLVCVVISITKNNNSKQKKLSWLVLLIAIGNIPE